MNVDAFLLSIPPLLVYLSVALVVGIESLGIPLPGELVLVAAALLSSRGELDVNPLFVALAGTAGAVIGDSVGYEVGHRYGRSLLGGLKRRFPKHFGAKDIAYAEDTFHRHGIWAVFFGRWIALLRIFAGPLSGILRMPYHRFLPANALGAITWCFATVYGVYVLGAVAETWLKRFAYVGLALFLAAALAVSTLLRRRVSRAVEEFAAANPEKVAAAENL